MQGGYIPTTLENFIFSLRLERVDYELALWDCSDQEDYERLRPFSYPGTEVVVIGLGINDSDSFENVSEKGSLDIWSPSPNNLLIALQWVPEIRHFLPKSAIILLRYNPELKNDLATILTLKLYGQLPVGEGCRLMFRDEYST